MNLPTTEQVSSLLALVAPGWVFIRVAAAFLPPREGHVGEVTVASVVLSLPLTLAARALLEWRGIVVAGDTLAVAAMLLGVVAAVLVGLALKVRRLRLALARLMFMSARRIWIPILDRHTYYVQVTLDSGRILFGWTEMFSNDPTATAPDLYLRDVATVRGDGQRDELENTVGVFVPAARIRTIQLLKPAGVKPSDVAKQLPVRPPQSIRQRG